MEKICSVDSLERQVIYFSSDVWEKGTLQPPSSRVIREYYKFPDLVAAMLPPFIAANDNSKSLSVYI